MAKTINYKRLSLAFVEKNYPVLFSTIQKGALELGSKKVDIDTIKEYVAGLCLEVALKSDGTVSLFTEDEDDIFFNEDLD